MNSQPGAYSGTRDQGRTAFRKNVASYDSKTEFFNKIWEACGFPNFASRPAVNFLDGMSGPGRLGLDLKERLQADLAGRAPRFSFYFNDVAIEPLKKLPEGMYHARCDVRELGQRFPFTFHIAAVRYGIKDLPQEEQGNALKSIYESLVPGGRIVVADMTADTAAAQHGIIEVHAAKQRLAGRNEGKEGRCYIPRLGEWTSLVAGAGFENIAIVHRDVSAVKTEDWKGQFAAGTHDDFAIPFLNSIIRDAAESNPAFNTDCAVRITAKNTASGTAVSDLKADQISVSLSFPIAVIAADKPK